MATRLTRSALKIRRFLATRVAAREERGWASYLLFLPAAFASGLGIWQIQRRSWKEDLLRLRESKVFSEPFSLFPRFTDITPYDRVTVHGIFLHDKSVFIGPRVRTIDGMPQKGYVLITPLLDPERFQPESLTHCGNDVVVLSHHVALVNRGWVPESWKEMSRNGSEGQQRQQTGNAAKIDGLVVESEKPSMFVPENDPVKGTWFWIDAIEIAKTCGLPAETPLIQVIQQTAQGKLPPAIHGGRGRTIEFNSRESYPVAKELSDFVNFSVMPVDHRNYAWIWFSLSLVTSFMAYRVTRGK